MHNWLFNRPTRLWGTAAVIAALAVAAFAIVMMVRINATMDRLNARPAATATPGATWGVPSPTTGDEQYASVPDPETTRRSLDEERWGERTPDQSAIDAFPEAGDPTPRVLAAVDRWRLWKFDALDAYMLPAAVEDSVANPPGTRAGDLKVTGVAAAVTPGPTQAVVEVPTNKGVLLVDVVVQDGKWWIESMGWKP